jgi:hypothetical protein
VVFALCAAVIKPIPSHLKLVTDLPSEIAADEDRAVWLAACQALEEVSGFALRECAGETPQSNDDLILSAPANPGVGATLGQFRLVLGARGKTASAKNTDDTHAQQLSLAQTKRLAASIVGLWSELESTRAALRAREAELAAGVPLTHAHGDGGELADTLEAALMAGAQAIGCQTAALYLLDEGTSVLKLRASYGYPRSKLLEPARPLRGALGDLEALLGHAVVLSTPGLFEYWHAPDRSGAAVCVPVCTSTTQLGTLWLYSERPRDFSDVETNVVELTAGRIAGELERQMLLEEGAAQRRRERDRFVAEETCAGQLPTVAPLVDGWEVAGTSWQSGQLGGAWHDWFGLGDGSLTIVGGMAAANGTAGAIEAAAMRGAARAFDRKIVPPAELLRACHDVLLSNSNGRPPRGLNAALLYPTSGRVELAAFGSAHALLLLSDGDARAAGETPWQPVTFSAATTFDKIASEICSTRLELQRGELLLLGCLGEDRTTFGSAHAARGQTVVDRLRQATRDFHGLSARRVLEAATELLRNSQFDADLGGSLIVLRRR